MSQPPPAYPGGLKGAPTSAWRRLLFSLRERFFGETFQRNASLLVLGQAINAITAFAFWILAAHLFKTSTVGLAASLISLGTLVATFTNLGLPNTVIRFLATSTNRYGLITAALLSVAAFSLVGGVLTLAVLKYAIPALMVVHHSEALSVLLVLLVLANAVVPVTDGVLMAFRRGDLVLRRQVLSGLLRVVLPLALAGFGLESLALTYVVMLLAGSLYSLVVVHLRLVPRQSPRPVFAELNERLGFMASNYFGAMFGMLPSTVTSIIVLSRDGPAAAAWFYIPTQLALFLNIISSSTGSALISEASQTHDSDLHIAQFRRALRHLYSVLMPAVLLIGSVGWVLLRAYGASYAAHGILPLEELSLASLLVGVNWLGDTWLLISTRSLAYFIMNALNAIAVVVLVYVGAGFGLVGAGLGWAAGQAVSAAVYIVIFIGSGLILSKRRSAMAQHLV